MRKFKDDGSNLINPLQRKIYFVVSILLISKPIVDYIFVQRISFLDIVDPILGVFWIWAINKNGMYKILRWYAEQQIKKGNYTIRKDGKMQIKFTIPKIIKKYINALFYK